MPLQGAVLVSRERSELSIHHSGFVRAMPLLVHYVARKSS